LRTTKAALTWGRLHYRFRGAKPGAVQNNKGVCVADRNNDLAQSLPDVLASPALLDAMVRAMPCAAAVLDAALGYRACNRAFSALFGTEPAELVGCRHEQLQADRGAANSLRTVLAHGDPLNIRSLTDHPEAPRAGWRASPLLDTQGKPAGLLLIARSIDREEAAADSPGEEPGWLSLVRNMPELFFRTDAGGRFCSVSPSARGLLDYNPEELEGRPFTELCVVPHDWDELRQRLRAQQGRVRDFQVRLRRRDGEALWVALDVLSDVDAAGEEQGLQGIARDISERRAADLHMRMLSKALEQTADSVMVTDRFGAIEYVNPAFESITGYDRQEVIGRGPALLRSGRHNAAFYRTLWGTISRGEVFRDVMINRRKDGELYYEAKTITPLRDDDGEIRHYVSTGKDISERMRIEERLFYMAHHDALTDLPNRTLFINRLEEKLALAPQQLHAVLFFGLDRFKVINDSLGHGLGDSLLQMLAKRLRQLVADPLDVARLSGDEFAIMLSGPDLDRDAVTELARAVLDTVAEPYLLEDQTLFLTSSLGISLAPRDGDDARLLLKHADVAMHRAKELGRNNYQFFSSEMGARAVQRLNMEIGLRQALERQEFRLHYQPQVDLLSDRVVGVEALLRWEHPEFGLVSPAEFVPVLEETRLIDHVGEWVLETACRQGQLWREQFDLPLRMAVNLTAREFGDPRLLKRLSRILDETGFDRHLLELELTESTIMRDDRHSVRVFNALWDMEVRIAVDDFGTGYSSLSYLKRFPIDTLKIDRGFIRDISTDPDDAAIVRAIIAMARSLNLHVVAEGVETDEQRDFLRTEGCHLVQGYLCHRPAPADQVAAFLAECQLRRQRDR
jgi:diguanylate cyclase (GGDEF)-like protein/PAS domain S-box-containing protein